MVAKMSNDPNTKLMQQIWINPILNKSELRYCYIYEIEQIIEQAREEGFRTGITLGREEGRREILEASRHARIG